LSDRFLERGVVNARIYVVAIASMAAPIALVPAFLIDNIWLTAPFFLLGGMLLTVPVAPGEAVVSDVVAAPLRGRAAAVRGVVRSLAALSPVVIGVLSDSIGLRSALAAVTPIYAVGGVMMLLATRTYPSDLAFVAAEADRLRTASPGVESDPRHVPSLPTGQPD
jgi:MFS family permease